MEKTTPFFSIIIPVYNTEAFLKKCIESILNQTYKDYEIILIDDGSTDDSYEICNAYKCKISNIVLYHQKNKGQAAARNKGVSMAKGQYIMFVDSDDYLANNAVLEDIYNVVDQQDLILGEWCELKNIGDKYVSKYNLNNIKTPKFRGIDFPKIILTQIPLFPWYPCIYAIKRQYYLDNQYKFKEGIKYEDFELMPKVVLNADCIEILPTPFYVYRINRQGSTTSIIKWSPLNDFLDIIKQHVNNILKTEKIDEFSKKTLLNNISAALFSIIIQVQGINDNDGRKALINKLQKNLFLGKYCYLKKQRIIFCLCNALGVRVVSKMLYMRKCLLRK